MSAEAAAEGTCTLSVVIPTHNVGAWVGETLRSVLVQDVPGMEVIVVDDHSDDDTTAIVARIAASDPRVTLVHAAARGGGSARNEGVSRARGRFLIFADGDDIVPDGAYRALVASLEESGSQLAIGDYLKFSPTSTWRPTASMKAFDEPLRGVGLAEIPTMIFSRPCWNKAFERSFWDEYGIRFPDVPRSNDIVPMVTAYVNAERIDVVDDVVYLYRDRPGATSMTAKASSAASFLSYLEQETICAGMILGRGDEELSSRYSALIHDRDGFFHLRKFLASWSGPQEDDEEVVRRFAELLATVDPPAAWIDVRKRTAMQLFSSGSILAARAAAQTVDGDGWRTEDGLIRLQAVRAFLEQAPEVAPGLVTEQSLRDLVARTLSNVPITDAEIEGEWVALAAAAEQRFGDDIRSRIPEFASGDVAAAAARQRAFAGSMTPLFGGDPLRLHARGASASADVVLWSSEGVVRPSRSAWYEGQDGALCEAEFAVSGLPLGVLLQPAFAFEDGVFVSAYADAQVPEYRAFENVLYEQDGSWVRLERRAHWVVRAPRRLAIKAMNVVRRILRLR